MKKTLLTREGMEKLQNDINHLRNVELKECIDDVSKAREEGSLEESTEYDIAKERYEKLNDKIKNLTSIFATAIIIDENSINTDTVQILTTVLLKNKNNNKELKYTIVPEIETNVKNNKISINSPVAKSLIGKSKGDIVNVKTPKSDIEFEILDITA